MYNKQKMGTEVVVPDKPLKDQIREQKRSVERSKRTLEREAKKLERERKKMLVQIKNLAQKGQTAGAKMLAKDIVRCKNQQAKLEQFIGQLSAVIFKITSCSSINELGDAMTSCANAMTLVSSKLDTQKICQLGKEMQKQDMVLDMKSEMMSDVLDSLDEGNEEDEEELLNQVLMEAGAKTQNDLNIAGNEVKMEESGGNDLDDMLKELNKK